MGFPIITTRLPTDLETCRGSISSNRSTSSLFANKRCPKKLENLNFWIRKFSDEDASLQKGRNLLNEPQEVTTKRVNLSTLPAELIGAIFDELDVYGAVYLSAVSQRFWEIGLPYIEKKHVDCIAPWAGHRIVCLGDKHTDLADYPLGMLSKDEEEEMAQGLARDDVPVSLRVSDLQACPVDLSIIARLKYEYGKFNFDHNLVPHVLGISAEEIRQTYFPDHQKWVLRNLTAHEFVRSETVAGNSEQNGPYFKDLGFEQIIRSRILWSSSSLNTEFNGRSLNRGIWAGHCLEITTLDHHIKSLRSDVAWKDISEDAVEDIIQLVRTSGCKTDIERE